MLPIALQPGAPTQLVHPAGLRHAAQRYRVELHDGGAGAALPVLNVVARKVASAHR